jgi:hypothetical protein
VGSISTALKLIFLEVIMGLIPYKDGMTCNHLQSPATKEKEEPSTHNIQEEIKFMRYLIQSYLEGGWDNNEYTPSLNERPNKELLFVLLHCTYYLPDVCIHELPYYGNPIQTVDAI